MPLPKVPYPLFEIEVPTTKKVFKFRRMKSPDEKILLVASESNGTNRELEILLACKQIVQNCAEEASFDVEKLSQFELHYFFVKIWANSVTNKISLTYKEKYWDDGDPTDDNDYNMEVNLDEVEVDSSKSIEPLIQLVENYAVEMKYTGADVLEKLKEEKKDFEDFILANSLVKIYNGDELIDCANVTEADLLEWVKSLDLISKNKLRTFLNGTPSISYEMKYTNKSGKERKIVLRSLFDFFQF